MPPQPQRLADGLWRWTERHPEWHPGDFGAEVACFAVEAPGAALLIDPLLPAEPDAVLALVDALAGGGELAILITIPYHVRSAEEIWRRHRARGGATIWGHPACAKRLDDTGGFRALAGDLPGGVTAHPIGKPRRFETPLMIPSHGALVFGDAVAEAGGKLRVWSNDPVDAKAERFYRERFNPTLEPLLELDFDRVLVTHGQPVMEDGREELRAALRRKPWYHRE